MHKWIVIFSITLVFFLFLFLCNHFIFFRIYYKDPTIPINTEWYSYVNNLYLKSSYDEALQDTTLSGTWIYGDDIIDLEIGIKYGRMFFRCEQFSLIISADYKLNKNGDIVLENISYDEKIDWVTQGDGSLVLSKNRGTQGTVSVKPKEQ